MTDSSALRKQALAGLGAALREARKQFCSACVNRHEPDLCPVRCRFGVIVREAASLLREVGDAHGGDADHEVQP